MKTKRNVGAKNAMSRAWSSSLGKRVRRKMLSGLVAHVLRQFQLIRRGYSS